MINNDIFIYKGAFPASPPPPFARRLQGRHTCKCHSYSREMKSSSGCRSRGETDATVFCSNTIVFISTPHLHDWVWAVPYTVGPNRDSQGRTTVLSVKALSLLQYEILVYFTQWMSKKKRLNMLDSLSLLCRLPLYVWKVKRKKSIVWLVGFLEVFSPLVYVCNISRLESTAEMLISSSLG